MNKSERILAKIAIDMELDITWEMLDDATRDEYENDIEILEGFMKPEGVVMYIGTKRYHSTLLSALGLEPTKVVTYNRVLHKTVLRSFDYVNDKNLGMVEYFHN